MKKIFNRIVVTVLILSGGSFALDKKMPASLRARMQTSSPADSLLCWLLFTDKGQQNIFPRLSQHSLNRRAKIGRELSCGDIPVSSDYIGKIKKTGAAVRVVSPWLNAVSVKATAGQIGRIDEFDFVKEIREVAAYHRPKEAPEYSLAPAKEVPALEYGLSEEQIKLMRVDELHQQGYTGSGVRLTIIDTGFDTWHQALTRTRVIAQRDFQRMIYDTISFLPLSIDTLPDTITSFEADQDSILGQTAHGTGMLSIAGGFLSGSIIGSAYNADYILAKTEKIYPTEDFIQEEDWWVAALQWAADSVGTDIVSSSLGYRQWSDYPSYTYPDMDGQAAFCTKAADSAASRGVLVVNSLGNVRAANPSLRPDTCLAAPADADSIISVGGVWPATRKWAFNPATGTGPAAGPPADSIKILPAGRVDSAGIRRIKPDVASAWQYVYACNVPNVSGAYDSIVGGVGTSGAASLTAGLCALLLEAHPSWGPDDVIKALKYSGSNRSTVEAFFTAPESLDITLGSYPNYNPGFSGIAAGHKYYTSGGTIYDFYNVYRVGWGIPDGIDALNYTTPEVVLAQEDKLMDPYPNPARTGDGEVYLPFFLIRDSYEVTIRIYTLDGRMIRKIDLGEKLAGAYPSQMNVVKDRIGSQQPARWDLMDDKGQPVPSGLYLALMTTGWNQSHKKIVVLR